MAKVATQPVSPRFSLNKVDAYKTLRGFLVTLLGAAIPFVAGAYLEWDYTWLINGEEYDLSLFLTAVIGTLLEVGRRFVSSNPATE